MKRKLLFVLLATIVVLAVTPLTAAAASLSSNVVALTSQDVKSTSSDGVKRNLDNDFAFSPIGKSKSPSKMLTAPPPASSYKVTASTDVSAMSSGNIYLIDAYAYLGINTSNKLTVLGDTATSQRVDAIYGQVILQRWDGSVWKNYTTYSVQSVTNKAGLTVAKTNITAPTGYYYQTNYFTYIEHGNRIESQNNYSGWLWHTN